MDINVGDRLCIAYCYGSFNRGKFNTFDQKLKSLKKQGNLKLVVGGSTLIGIVGSGCASCGLPILALLGLSGSVAYLPFRGIELSYISVMLLLFSLYHLIKANNKNECEIVETK